jgi:transcriptional regulator with XRE-family HTH domain
MDKPLKVKLKEELKKRGLKIPALADQTGIPKDRIYAWYRDDTNPKAEDAVLLEEWIKGGTSLKNGENFNSKQGIEPEIAITATTQQQLIGAIERLTRNNERLLDTNEKIADTNRILANKLAGMEPVQVTMPPETEATINEMTILLMGLRDYTAQIGASVKKTDAISEMQNIHKMVSSAKKDLEKRGKTVGVGR